MSRAEAARDKAARLAAQRHAQVVDPETVPDVPSAQPAAPAPAPRQTAAFQRKSVRVTLDLAPALYDDFDDWRRRTARQTGMPKIKSVDVLRVLLRRLMADEAFAAQVIEALRKEARRQ